MVTGKEKFLRFTVGLTIMQKMEEILFRRQNRLVRMRVNTKASPNPSRRGLRRV
jgi:hypothetical protein